MARRSNHLSASESPLSTPDSPKSDAQSGSQMSVNLPETDMTSSPTGPILTSSDMHVSRSELSNIASSRPDAQDDQSDVDGGPQLRIVHVDPMHISSTVGKDQIGTFIASATLVIKVEATDLESLQELFACDESLSSNTTLPRHLYCYEDNDEAKMVTSKGELAGLIASGHPTQTTESGSLYFFYADEDTAGHMHHAASTVIGRSVKPYLEPQSIVPLESLSGAKPLLPSHKKMSAIDQRSRLFDDIEAAVRELVQSPEPWREKYRALDSDSQLYELAAIVREAYGDSASTTLKDLPEVHTAHDAESVVVVELAVCLEWLTNRLSAYALESNMIAAAIRVLGQPDESNADQAASVARQTRLKSRGSILRDFARQRSAAPRPRNWTDRHASGTARKKSSWSVERSLPLRTRDERLHHSDQGTPSKSLTKSVRFVGDIDTRSAVHGSDDWPTHRPDARDALMEQSIAKLEALGDRLERSGHGLDARSDLFEHRMAQVESSLSRVESLCEAAIDNSYIEAREQLMDPPTTMWSPPVTDVDNRYNDYNRIYHNHDFLDLDDILIALPTTAHDSHQHRTRRPASHRRTRKQRNRSQSSQRRARR